MSGARASVFLLNQVRIIKFAVMIRTVPRNGIELNIIFRLPCNLTEVVYNVVAAIMMLAWQGRRLGIICKNTCSVLAPNTWMTDFGWCCCFCCCSCWCCTFWRCWGDTMTTTDIILTQSVTICFPLRRPRLSVTSLLLRSFFYNAAAMSGPCPSPSHEEYSNGVKFERAWDCNSNLWCRWQNACRHGGNRRVGTNFVGGSSEQLKINVGISTRLKKKISQVLQTKRKVMHIANNNYSNIIVE